MTFGERLKLAIKEHDLNQREFGEKLGLTPKTAKNISGYVWRLCNGRRQPRLELLQKILYALPMTNARWLITGKDDLDTLLELPKDFPNKERKEENEVQ